jgi:hypothetical protein
LRLGAEFYFLTVGGFADLISEQFVHWLTAILLGVLLLMQLAFLRESLYPRRHMYRPMPATAISSDCVAAAASSRHAYERWGYRLRDASAVPLPRTAALPFLLLRPVPGLRHPKPWDAAVRFVRMFRFAAVVLAVVTYNALWYMWISAVLGMMPAAYAQYPPHIQGLLATGLLLGTLVAELCVSGRLSDVIVARLARRNDSVRVAEMRLWLAYPAALLSAGSVFPSFFFFCFTLPHVLLLRCLTKGDENIVGLTLWGVSIDQRYHWMVGQIAFFLCEFRTLKSLRKDAQNQIHNQAA